MGTRHTTHQRQNAKLYLRTTPNSIHNIPTFSAHQLAFTQLPLNEEHEAAEALRVVA